MCTSEIVEYLRSILFPAEIFCLANELGNDFTPNLYSNPPLLRATRRRTAAAVTVLSFLVSFI